MILRIRLDLHTKQALGSSPTFIVEVMERLHYPKAVVGKTLLSMLRQIHQHHSAPAALVRDFDLYQIVLKLSQNESQVLVAELAAQLLQDFDGHTDDDGNSVDNTETTTANTAAVTDNNKNTDQVEVEVEVEAKDGGSGAQ